MFDNFPILLAPMEDITDSTFRCICKQYGADIVCSEFIASDGLVRGIEKSFQKLAFKEHERIVGIQIFGKDVETMSQAAQIAAIFKPDFIDLNFGCPVKKIVNKGGGAALLNDIPKMTSIAAAVVKSIDIPVTAKTRLGWDSQSKNIVDVAERLQDTGIKALTIHARTKAQMYAGEADWTLIGAVKNNPRMHIPIFGNGDVTSPEAALDYKNKCNVDGLMIGRASIGNPWIFNQIKHFLKTGKHLNKPNLTERIDVCKDYLIKSVEVNGTKTGILKVRRHYTGFFKELPSFKPYRLKLVTSDSVEQIIETLDEVKAHYASVSF